MLNLGFFAVLVALHFLLDLIKYREVHQFNWSRTLEGAVREGIVDFTMLAFGLVVAVYLHPSLAGFVGIKGLMLAELTIVRGAGIIASKLKILYNTLKIFYHIEVYLDRIHPYLGKKFSPVEIVCIGSLVIMLALLITAPTLLGLSGEEYLRILLDEGIPWRL